MVELGRHNTAFSNRRPAQADCAARAHHLRPSNFSDISTHGYAPKEARLEGRQLEVAQMVALGLADKEIAHYLEVSQGTVKAHVSLILRRLNLYRRTQICRFVYEAGLFQLG